MKSTIYYCLLLTFFYDFILSDEFEEFKANM